MIVLQAVLKERFIDQMFNLQGGDDLFTLIALTLFAIVLFKILTAVAEAMVAMVATTVRVAAQALPFLLIMALLLVWMYGA